MHDKYLILCFYGILGLAFALAPSIVAVNGVVDRISNKPCLTNWNNNKTPIFYVLVAPMVVYYSQHKMPWVYFASLTLVAFCCSFKLKNNHNDFFSAFSGALLGGAVATTLPWWRQQSFSIEIAFYELSFFSIILTLSTIILSKQSLINKNSWHINALIFTIYSIVLFYLSFTLAAVSDSQVLRTLWHHWGAYIDPTDLAIAGARIFYDIPVQYGMGPTLLIGSFCSSDCWQAAYWVISITSLLFGIGIGAIAFIIGKRSYLQTGLVLLICLVTCTLWNSYPPNVASPNVTPSTNGLRFLPGVVLVFWILYSEKMVGLIKNLGGHFFWVIGALWSPEALFYVTAIWWPVYLFDFLSIQSAKQLAVERILRALAELLLIAIASFALFCFVYFAVFDVWPVPKYFIAYMLYPPGPLPMNPHGPILFWSFAVLLSAFVSYSVWFRTNNSSRFRQSMTLQLLAFAATSYYLGRSHDNNVLNLLPFIMLVLLDLISYDGKLFYRLYASTALASLLAWLSIFGWKGWEQSILSSGLANFGYASINKKLSYDNEKNRHALMEVNSAINEEQLIETNNLVSDLYGRGDSFVVMDQFFLLQPRYKTQPWCAIESATNFEFFPSPLRREFLKNTASKLNRSGWLIIARDHNINTWLDDFYSAYVQTDRIDLKYVYAIKFSPKAL